MVTSAVAAIRVAIAAATLMRRSRLDGVRMLEVFDVVCVDMMQFTP